MSRQMKVIQTPVRFYPEIGGVENHVYYLGKELVKQNIAVEVVCAGNAHLQPEKEGILIKRLRSWFKITNTNITLQLPFVLMQSQFDILHTHMPTPWTADWSVLIAKLRKKKSIITIHNDMQKTGFLPKLITDIYLHTAFTLTLTLVDKIIIVNPSWEESFHYTRNLLKRFENKITIIPNGVDTILFEPSEKKEKDTILFVSVLDKYHEFKGFEVLLHSMQLVTKKIPKVKLHVIGEGELKTVYTKLADTLGLSKHILFLGEKKQEELPTYFGKASVFVLPSIHTEGYGIVLLEALSSKTPVVTTTIAGISKDITKYKAGFVVEPYNENDLAEALINVLQSETLMRSQALNGRKLVEEKYSWQKIAKDIISLYKEVVR